MRAFLLFEFCRKSIFLLLNGAKKVNFCLMNVNEEICKNLRPDLECLKEKTDFSALVEINGKATCTFTTKWHYYISEYDAGIDANSPNNIVLLNDAVF